MSQVNPGNQARGEVRRASGTTLHICAQEHWIAQQPFNEYEPEQYATDGFVHCTDDRTRLIEIANLFYQRDLRPYVALVIDLKGVPAPAIYEDEASEFPHIYGRVPLNCIRQVVEIARGPDGTFLNVADAAYGTRD